MSDLPSYRLPRAVEPDRYRLEIVPDLDAATFTGTEEVAIAVHEPVDEIILNAAELEVSEAVLTGADGVPAQAAAELDEAEERLVLRLGRTATPGRYRLSLRFAGSINDKLRGFYRSTFRDETGAERVIAATQFEATDARRAFPCWDEPDRKAVFSVAVAVPDGVSVYSNWDEAERSARHDGRTLVRFADTMKMSTYLVAWVVGPLEATDPVDVDGVPLRVVHAPGKGHLAGFALEAGAHALRFLAGWFGIPYPGAKLDLIALPDFAFGAMENVGAVTFRESLLLIDPAEASQVEMERVAEVVSHEIAHMWFGDLVTMKWWNGLWLNEAFATFMELLCVDDFRPEWDTWVSFGLSRGAAMTIDGLATTRAIEFPVARPEEAEGMFDTLTYQKGAGVLRMLEQFLGGERFRDGIRHYLRAHSYGNAETTDLWDGIEEATGEPARTTMDSWIFQEGHPVLSVEADGGTVHLSQRRFTYQPLETDTSWNVPVLVRASVGDRPVERRVLVTGESATVDLEGEPDFVVVNAGGSGFYRVRYAPKLLAALTDDLSKLGAVERFNLVSDTWAAALAGMTDLAEYLSLVQRIGAEDDPAVWSMALGGLDLLHRVASDGQRPAMESFIRDLARPAFDDVGWEKRAEEPEKRGRLRSVLLGALGTTGADETVRERAAELHRALLSDRSAVEADLAGALATVVAWNGGPNEYGAFLDRFRNPSTPQEEVRYLYALGSFRPADLVERTLEMSLTEVRTQNAPFLLSILLSNRAGGPAAWRFVRDNWERILDRFPQNTIVRMLEGLSTLCTPELSREIIGFFAEHPIRSGQQTLDQILERLQVNTAFGERVRAGDLR